MNLTIQFLDDYRELERKLGDLTAENADLRRKLHRLEAAARSELTSQVEETRAERDRLRLENLQLRNEVQLWMTRHADLARE